MVHALKLTRRAGLAEGARGGAHGGACGSSSGRARLRGTCLRSARGGWALLAAGLLAGCTTGVLDPHGPVAAQQRTIILNAVLIMFAVAIPTILAAVWFTWWFRSTNPRARYQPDFVYSGRVEIVMWSVPLLVTLFLAGLIWTGSRDLDPYRPLTAGGGDGSTNASMGASETGHAATSAAAPSDQPPGGRTLQVQAIALDWKWLFIYPEQRIATVNELTIPAGTPVHFALTSGSVLNTFYIPQLGGMIYLMNGMVTQINLQADDPGDYYGRSGHFSGDGYPAMEFMTHALPDAQFAQWVEATRRAGHMLDRTEYAQLAKQGVIDHPLAYGAADPRLFSAVSTQEIPPAPGPNTGRGGDAGIEEKGQR